MFKKILIPTDGSSAATQAAHAGIDFAKSIGAEVVVVSVAQPFAAAFAYDGLGSGYAFSEEDIDKSMLEQAEAYVQPIAERAREAGLRVDGRAVSHINVAQGIVQAATDSGCDLIFIGSHGRSGLSRLLLGSVTAKVLPLASMAVLVHRAKEEQ